MSFDTSIGFQGVSAGHSPGIVGEQANPPFRFLFQLIKYVHTYMDAQRKIGGPWLHCTPREEGGGEGEKVFAEVSRQSSTTRTTGIGAAARGRAGK